MIMLRRFFVLLGCSSLLMACVVSAPMVEIQAATEPHAASDVAPDPVAAASAVAASVGAVPNDSLPYPKLDEQEQIDQLTIEINRLKKQMELMTTRIRQLEQRQISAVRPNPPKNQPKLKSLAAVSLPMPLIQPTGLAEKKDVQPTHVSILEQAEKSYAQGDYPTVLTQLRGADDGGDGSVEAQQKMWLLLQSNHKLKKCQSVIHIGQRFVSRFAQHERAPEALFMVGQCQWDIQQQDIARDTWRNLIRRYPSSSFVVQATQAIQRRK